MALPQTLGGGLLSAQVAGADNSSLRSKKMSELIRSMPRQAARFTAPQPIREAPSTLQQGLSSLARSIKAAQDIKKEKAATDAIQALYNRPDIVDPALQNMSGPDMMQMPTVSQQPSSMELMQTALQFPGTKSAANAMNVAKFQNLQEQQKATQDFRFQQLAQAKELKELEIKRQQASQFTLMPLADQKKLYPNVDPQTTRLMVNGLNQVKPQTVKSLATEKALRASSATNINIDQKSLGAEGEAAAKSLVKQNEEIDTAALNSERNMTENLMVAKHLNDQTGENDDLPSGLVTRMGGWLIWAGFDPAKVDNALGNVQNGQKFQSLILDQLLKKMMAQKGPQTKEDQAIMLRTLPGLGVGRRARDFLLRAAMAVAQRDIDKSNFWGSYVEEKGTRKGALKAYFRQQNGVPLFGYNKKGKRYVFYNEFRNMMKQAEPNLTAEEIRTRWKMKYGKSVQRSL